MIRRFAKRFAVVLALFATPLAAQDLPSEQRAAALGGLRPLASADAAQRWTGVGRLDTGVSFCSATLVSDRHVLTAAHCLFDPRTGARIDDGALVFQAGLRNGRPEALRGVRRSVFPSDYVLNRSPDLDSIARDIAVLELDLPLRTGRIAAIAPGRGADRGEAVTVVSYGADREAHASIEEGCLVLERHGTVRLLSCRVVQGSSGAPVLRMTGEGPELVAIISATATDRSGQDVSMAVAPDGDILALIGGASQGGARLSRPDGDGGRSGLGARFLRP